MNRDAIQTVGGNVEALDLDWTAQRNIPRFHVVIGADVVYERHLFRSLLSIIQRAAPRAVLVQNTARKGTAEFKALCLNEGACIEVLCLDHAMDAVPDLTERAGAVY